MKLSRKNQQNRFSYQSLEPKQMLSINAPNIGPASNSQLVDGFTDAQQAVFDNVREHLEANESTRYLFQGESGLRQIEVKHGLASTTTRWQQTFQGIPIHNTIITVNQGPDGEYQNVFDNLAHKSVEAPIVATADFDLDQAELIAMDHANVVSTFAETRGEIAWHVDADGRATKVWDLTVYGHQPTGDFLTLVDVETGEVIKQENRMAFFTEGTGDVYEPNPYQTQGSGAGLDDADDANSAALEAQLISVTLEGLDEGTGLLTGEFVDLASLDSPDLPDVDADEANRVYEYTRDDDRFEQVVVYHSVDQMNRYFHALGFDDDTGTPNGIRDFPSLANAHWFDADNSFYSTGDDAIHFGDGGVDDAEDADIVAHEYGHAVQFNQNAGWGGGEMGAMGEGFGDYLAVTFYHDFGYPAFQADHAPAVGEWDATSYSNDDPPNLRRVDGNKMWPDDTGFGVHADGEIWSRALWDLRTNLGGVWADTLILEHHFTLASGANMPAGANGILQANENINQGVFQAAVRHPFVERGILNPQNMVSFNSLTYAADDPTAPIVIAVSDRDASGTIQVNVDTADGDSEVVTLTETDNGLFLGTINVVGNLFTPLNGVLEVISESTEITVSYPSGGGGVTTDTAMVTSDVVVDLSIGEVGRLESVTSEWQTVTFVGAYDDPVVVAGPSSRNGASPLNVRIRNVTDTSFQIRVHEWEYLDGIHRNREVVDYLVVEAGEFELQDGTKIVAKNRDFQSSRWTTNSLSNNFVNSDEAPVVLTQVVSTNDPTSVTARTRFVSKTEFQMRLQEEQAQDGFHAGEKVSWIAIEQGTGQIGSQDFEANRTGNAVTHINYRVNFANDYNESPAFFANMQTFRGGDPATIRYRALNENYATIYVEEERSADPEIRHNPESVGYLAIGLGEIFGSSTDLRPTNGNATSDPSNSFGAISNDSTDGYQLRYLPLGSDAIVNEDHEDSVQELDLGALDQLAGALFEEIANEGIEAWEDGLIEWHQELGEAESNIEL